MKYEYEVVYIRDTGVAASESCISPRDVGDAVCRLLALGHKIKKINRLK